MSWLKHPWLMLIFGSVIALGLWVGIGLWIEHQRALAQEELDRTPGITSRYLRLERNAFRLPVWLPELLGALLPQEHREKVQIEVKTEWQFFRPLTDHELRLFDRIPDVEQIRFVDPQAVSDEALLHIIERHRLWILEFSGGRRLTTQHLAALARNERLIFLRGLRGPFDQSMLDELAKIEALRRLTLDGRLDESVSFGSLPALYSLEWDHSELSDEQFATLAAGANPSHLTLLNTRLTARSWPILEKMNLGVIVLESPHINDATVHSLVGQTELARVQLRGGSLSDAAIEELLTLPELMHLEVEGRGLTIASARQIRSFATNSKPKIIDPHIVIRGGPHVTDEWLAELAAAKLSGIGLLNSAITDEGVNHLKGHEDIWMLNLPGSHITDSCMPIFGTLPGLVDLDLRNTAITDVGLRQLSLANISLGFGLSLHAGGTRITKEGVEELLKRHPQVKVYGVEGLETPGEFDDLIPLDDQAR